MLYPFRFAPIFRDYIWGGRRLQSMLGKKIGDAERYAESWEIVDHGTDQSVVTEGPLAGWTLSQLLAECPEGLMGAGCSELERFPLLFKFLDCNRNLSVQVHPNDAQAALLDPPDLGKTEAWIVIEADPGALIYAGLKPGVDRSGLAMAVERGTTEECLHRIEPTRGDCIFIPAGTVHALGAGLVIAEIQQSSDTTYRLFDWNRVDAEGNARPLHVEQSLDVIDFERGPVEPSEPVATGSPGRERLVACDKFVLERLTFDHETVIGGDERVHLLAVLGGQMQIEGDPCVEPAQRGTTVLVPASAGETRLSASASSILMDIYLP